MPVRAILFDLFDTLVDLPIERLPVVMVDGKPVASSYETLHQALARRTDLDFDLDFETFARTLRAVDREFRERLWAQGLEFPCVDRFRELAARLGLDAPELPQELTEIHMGGIRRITRYLPDHPLVLESLRRHTRLGVCSNFNHSPTAVRVLEEAGLLPHFDAVVISEDVGYRKPRPEIFREALRRLGTSPEETVHVGDQLAADVDGAAQLGMRTVWLTRRVDDRDARLERHAGAAPTWAFRELASLHEIVPSTSDS